MAKKNCSIQTVIQPATTLLQCTQLLGNLSAMAINHPEMIIQIHEAIRAARGMIKGCRVYIEGRKFKGAPYSQYWEYVLAN